jgi:hypothetical protein
LDRDTSSKEEMLKKYDSLFDIFDRLDNKEQCPDIENYESGINCDTSFTYPLDGQGI